MDVQAHGRDRLSFGPRATDPIDAPNIGRVPRLDVRVSDEDRLSISRAGSNNSAILVISGVLLLGVAMASTWVIASILDGPTRQPTSLTPSKVASPIDVFEPSK